jgi:AcrR family transcriptional regulator
MAGKRAAANPPVVLGAMARYSDHLRAEMQERSFASKGERTRFRLKMAAAAALEEKGFQELKVADVCRLAHVALGTFYVYFPDKSAIASEVLLDFGDALYTQVQGIARGNNHYEAILLTNQFFIASYQRNAGLVRCLIQLEDQEPEFRARWRQRRLQWIQKIARSIARRSGDPEVPESMYVQIAYALEGMVFQYFYDIFVRRDPILSPIAGSPEHVASLMSVLWYRAVYCENPPAEQVAFAEAALKLHRRPEASDDDGILVAAGNNRAAPKPRQRR